MQHRQLGSTSGRQANQALVVQLRATATARGATQAQIALAWLLAQQPWIPLHDPAGASR